MDTEREARVKSEIEANLRRQNQVKFRDQCCLLKAKNVHHNLPFLAQHCVSIETLTEALKKDWDMRMEVISKPYMRIPTEDLAIHLLLNPLVFKEPEIVFLMSLFQLEKGMAPFYNGTGVNRD